MTSIFAHKQIIDTNAFWEYALALRFPARRDAYFILETVIKNPELLEKNYPSNYLEILRNCVTSIRESHDPIYAADSIGHTVETFFTLIASNPVTVDLLAAYRHENIISTYSHLMERAESRYYSASARAAIIHALQSSPITEAWINDLEDHGNDIVFLHSSHPATAINKERKLSMNGEKMQTTYELSPETQTFISTPNGTLWARHNHVPEPIQKLEWPFGKLAQDKEKLLQILHALATVAVEKCQTAVNGGSNNPPFADVSPFLDRVNRELELLQVTPLHGFDAATRSNTTSGVTDNETHFGL